MVAEYIDFFVNSVVPSTINFMNTSFIQSGVSLLGFIIAVALLSIIIGGILIR